MRLLLLILFCCLSSLTYSQKIETYNIVIDTFVHGPSKIERKLARKLQGAISNYLVSSPLLFKVVDRNILNLVDKERNWQRITKKDVISVSEMLGAAYILRGTLIDFSIDTEPIEPRKQTEEQQIKKLPKQYNKIRKKVKAFVEVEFIEVATGSVMGQSNYTIAFKKEYPYSENQNRIFIIDHSLLRHVAKCFQHKFRTRLFKTFDPTLRILDTDAKNKRFLITGGYLAGFPHDAIFKVIQPEQEMVNGQNLLREKIVGYLNLTTKKNEVSWCKTKKIKFEELKALLNEDTYLKFDKVSRELSCQAIAGK